MAKGKENERIGGSSSLSIDLAGKLRAGILDGSMPPGSRLTEQLACGQYGVSRTPVREALRILEAEGLVEIVPNRGAFVVGLSGGDISDLFELRRLYEAQAVRWAVSRIEDAEMEELEESFEFMEFYTKKGDSRRMKELNARFHKCIYEAAHSRVIRDALNSYQSYLLESGLTHSYQKDQLGEILEEHRRIFAAFKSQNPEMGALAMDEHIRNAAKRSL